MSWLTKRRLSFLDLLSIALTLKTVELFGVAWGIILFLVLMVLVLLAEDKWGR